MMTNKKAQEEIMGFVILIVVIIIIGLVFFAFSLRKATTIEPEHNKMDDFIQSTLSYTTGCVINFESQNIKELIRQCDASSTSKCENNITICTELNSTITNIVHSLLGTEITNFYVHGYSLNISGSSDSSKLFIKEGNLTGNYFASSTSIPSLDSPITLKLKVYYLKAQ